MSERPLRLVRRLSGRASEFTTLLTSSRRPSRRTRTLIKDLESAIYGVVRFTRGHESLRDLNSIAIANGFKRVVIINEWRGNPGLMVIYSPSEENLVEIGRLKIVGVKLRRELGRRDAGQCREVVSSSKDETTIYITKLLADAFQLRAAERPDADYLEVSLDGDQVAIAPRKRKTNAIFGPLLRVVVPNGPRKGRA
ncbi:hypothetical protein [Acidilobus sp.]|uniref:hypothetical protein n=1 Tax=Acidilobus sp. TaxID=1872109 RepID=UPI003D07DE5B